MAAKVILQVLEGHARRDYVFTDRTLCALGRAEDCLLHLPDDFLTISRHHCLFDIDPPEVRIRDLGSRNGTFVNGKKIGQRDRRESPDAVFVEGMPECILKDGDEVRVASLGLRVHVVPEPQIGQARDVLSGTDRRGSAAASPAGDST
jgi:eukaryotic-like serine/threonine-protein kinase